MNALRVRYQTIELGDLDIHVRTLRDNQQYLDADGVAEGLGISSANWPLFGVIWESGTVLARIMLDYRLGEKRILEVGCGIALASLVLNQRHADITATDYHPEAEHFLAANVLLNNGREIPFVRTDWGDTDSGLGRFDVVIGSDLLYEHGYAELLAGFIERHAKSHCEVIIVDPGRPHRARFSKEMLALGYTHEQHRSTPSDDPQSPFGGQVLRYMR